VIEYSALEIYRELIAERKGETAKDHETTQKRDKMKQFLRETVGNDQIEQINLDELKSHL